MTAFHYRTSTGRTLLSAPQRHSSLCHNARVSLDSPTETKRPIGLAIFLIIVGVIGWLAAFALTLDKFTTLENPNAHLTCDVNPLVGCAKNLASWEGSVLGFPNPIIGLACWVAPIAVGVGILAAARYRRWFWMLFNVGVLGAIVLVVFLIYTSLYQLYVLCPYCMITWVVTIPTFWTVTFYNLKEGNIPTNERTRAFFGTLYGWIPLITLVCYAIVAILAQVQVQWIPNAFR